MLVILLLGNRGNWPSHIVTFSRYRITMNRVQLLSFAPCPTFSFTDALALSFCSVSYGLSGSMLHMLVHPLHGTCYWCMRYSRWTPGCGRASAFCREFIWLWPSSNGWYAFCRCVEVNNGHAMVILAAYCTLCMVSRVHPVRIGGYWCGISAEQRVCCVPLTSIMAASSEHLKVRSIYILYVRKGDEFLVLLRTDVKHALLCV